MILHSTSSCCAPSKYIARTAVRISVKNVRPFPSCSTASSASRHSSAANRWGRRSRLSASTKSPCTHSLSVFSRSLNQQDGKSHYHADIQRYIPMCGIQESHHLHTKSHLPSRNWIFLFCSYRGLARHLSVSKFVIPLGRRV